LPPAITYSEHELVYLLRQQNQEAFNYLYQNYSAVLYGVISRVISDQQTAQDVLQEVFVKIWTHIDSYDAGKGKVYTWMINIARNAAIDKLRSKGEIMKGKIHTGEDHVYNLQQQLKTEQHTDAIGLRKLIAELKPEYQRIIELSYFKGFTLEEISKMLEVPLGTVKTRMRHAIQLLREKFSR